MKTQKKWGARDRKFFAESVYEMVRWWRYFGALAGFDPTLKPTVDKTDVLRIWAAWCFNTHGVLPEWAEFGDFDKTAFEKNKAAITSGAIKESIPDWLYEYGQQEFGDEWPTIIKSLNQPAEVFLRTNTIRITRDELIQKLKAEEIEVVAVEGLPDAVRLPERKNVFMTDAFKKGYFEVQDGASQMVAPLLRVEPGQRVVDACAGAGGKSLHLAALMKNKGKIVAMDIHDWKLEDLKERARRNGVDIIETRPIESNKVVKRLENSADRLLLDVPCSGLGVLRRNPDKKWKITLEDIQRLQQLQMEILRGYCKIVKPGGMMVYATCSLLPSENQNQVQKFLAENDNEWSLVEQIHVFPHLQGFDGFYGALLRRKE
jgi:16S rRNA (cytosine967-C5)-methyltransferase